MRFNHVVVALAALCAATGYSQDSDSERDRALRNLYRKEGANAELKRLQRAQRLPDSGRPNVLLEGSSSLVLDRAQEPRLTTWQLAKAKAAHDEDHKIFYGRRPVPRGGCTTCGQPACVCGAIIAKKTTTTRTKCCDEKPSVTNIYNNISYEGQHHNDYSRVDNRRWHNDQSARIRNYVRTGNSQYTFAPDYRYFNRNNQRNTKNYAPRFDNDKNIDIAETFSPTFAPRSTSTYAPRSSSRTKVDAPTFVDIDQVVKSVQVPPTRPAPPPEAPRGISPPKLDNSFGKNSLRQPRSSSNLPGA